LGDAHVPQVSWFPQPSPAGPQLMPSWAHVFGVHLLPLSPASTSPSPQTLGVPLPPQVCGVLQLPH
jgi:hypothetical protein